ncbi:MAG TPA: hypothetical protein DD377_06355 [Firmicutes bacterium]|nr:hypothetical protein [Bacillota bacterium]
MKNEINFPKFFVTSDFYTKKYQFSKINLFFGYSQSGKSSTLSFIESLFSGKEKKWLINSSIVGSGDYQVISISDKEGINDHLKLSSKSLLSKILLNSNYSEEFTDCCNKLSDNLTLIQNYLFDEFSKKIPFLNLEIKKSADPLDFLLNNISFSFDNYSSSANKKALYSLIKIINDNFPNKCLIFVIDDFNLFMDEEETCLFFDLMNETNAYFFLSSSHPIPQHLLDEDFCIYAIRNGELFFLPSLDKLISDSLFGQDQYMSFEEYMLNEGYAKNSGEISKKISLLKDDFRCNLLRILCSKNPCLGDESKLSSVKIFPEDDVEKAIYSYVFNILEIK